MIMYKYHIAVVTTTRAEYGLLSPFIHRLYEDSEVDLRLIVSGTHLSKKHGYTVAEIEHDGIPIQCRIPILTEGNMPYDSSITMANTIQGFAQYFRDNRPELLVISGDRTEMLAIACTAMNERIPMAHYSGGEVTEGAVDDCVRHALTKMSYLHFTSTEIYRKRVIQLGEDPARVFNVGALGKENIDHAPLMDKVTICKQAGISCDRRYVVVTFHPVTLDSDTAGEQATNLCKVMEERCDLFFLITKSNADTGSDKVNHILTNFATHHDNANIVDSLGMVRYLSALKYAAFVLGNSSSGIVEAPILGIPTVNIGDRQKGRIMAETIINCEPTAESIVRAIAEAEHMPHIRTSIYGSGNTSYQMTKILKEMLSSGNINLKKGFYEEKRKNIS